MRARWVAIGFLLTSVVAVPGPRHVDATPSGDPTPIITDSATVVGLSEDGHRALVTLEPDEVDSFVIDLVTQQSFPVPAYAPGEVLLAKDGRSVFITTADSFDPGDIDTLYDVYQWFPDTDDLVFRTLADTSGQNILASDANYDGSELLGIAYPFTPYMELFVGDNATSLHGALADPRGMPRPRLSDDGQRLIYLDGTGQTLSVWDRATGRAIQLEHFSVQDLVGTAFAISADGSTVAYTVTTTMPLFEPTDYTRPLPPSNANEHMTYVVRRVDSLYFRIVGEAPDFDPSVALNHDGTRVAFTTTNPSGMDQAVVSDVGQPGLTTISRTPNGDGDGDVTELFLSSDGTTAAFTTDASNLVALATGPHAFRASIDPPLTAGLVAIRPARLLETRPNQLPTVDGAYSGVGRNGQNTVLPLPVAGRGGVPANASGAMLNVTVTEPDGPGFATVFPCGQTLPIASNLNFPAGATVANNVFTALGGGAACVYTNVAADIVVDVTAYVLPGTGFEAISPKRMLDTRSVDAPTVDGRYAAGGRRLPGTVTVFQIGGRAGVDSAGGAYFLTVTAVDPQAAGFLTVYPCSGTRPLASNLNFVAGQTVANTVVVQPGDVSFETGVPGPPATFNGSPGSIGTICIFTSAPTDLVVDVNGYALPRGQYSRANRAPVDSTFVPVTPARLLETRAGQGSTVDGQYTAIGQRATNTDTSMQVVGRGGVPAGATAVVLNITSTASTQAGFVTAYPCGGTRPSTSNLNYAVGQTVANNVVAKIGDSGAVCLFNSGATDLVVDVAGYVSVTPPDVCFWCPVVK